VLGIDTNILMRFLVRDDEAQFDRAQRLIRRGSGTDPVFVNLLVLLETEWVLRSHNELTKVDVLDAFSELLSSVELAFEDEASIESALYVWKNSAAQFADCLIGARHIVCGCRATASFDQKASKLPGFVAA
jgi:predicted nucleic-acid-binding protein